MTDICQTCRRPVTEHIGGVVCKEDGGPAFPTTLEDHRIRPSDGMALRDWFAGQAIAGFLPLRSDGNPETYATVAYALADAMIAERSKRQFPEVRRG